MAVVLNPQNDTVHAVVQQGVSWPGEQWLELARFPFLERARSSGQAAFVRDAREEAAMPRRVTELFHVRSIVAVPLSVDEVCFGFVVGDREGAVFELGADDLALLTALGQVAAVFLAKADEYEDLQRLDKAKRDFISVASHELRTPITVVHGITSTLHLRGPQLHEDQLLQLRTTLFQQTTRLVELVEKLLDLSRLESGAIDLAPIRFHPRERIDGLLPQLVPDRLGDINVAVAPELELFTDPHAVDRVISNLVVNALRHGEPPICVRDSRNHRVRLVVEDCGPGVEPEFVPQLFERFARSTSSRALGSPGAGLGLSIARSYAEAIGGALTYEPGSPTGARFALSLPAEALAA
jgi:two-component system sensor histidine kinase MtrB